MLLAGASAAQRRTELPVTVHGFVMGNLAVRSTGERPPKGDGGAFVLGETRLRFDVSRATNSGKARVWTSRCTATVGSGEFRRFALVPAGPKSRDFTRGLP